VSIAVHAGLVYVANAGAHDSNYTGFTLNGGGHLQPLDGSTFALPEGSTPATCCSTRPERRSSARASGRR
jgi:hypothetical protein